jgi:hypothetical protein
VERGVLVVSPSRDYVREAIAKAAGKETPRLGRQMSLLLEKVDPKQTGWFAVFDHDEDLAFHGGFTLTEACKAEITIAAPSEQAAKDQLEQVQADLGRAREYLGGVAGKAKALVPLVEMVKAATASRDGKHVTLKLELGAGRLQHLLEKAGEP